MAARRRRIAAATPTSEKALFQELDDLPDAEVMKRLHALAGMELERGRQDRGLYYVALAQAGGDDGRTRAEYISSRVDGLLEGLEAWRDAQADAEQTPTGANGFDLFMIAVVVLVILAFVFS